MTFATGPLSGSLTPVPAPSNMLVFPPDRVTLWQPGLSYNTVPGQSGPGIPTNATQFGSTLSPIGQLSTFTGSTTANSNSLTVSGVAGTLAADQLVFDAAMTTCFGLINGGSGTSWSFQDNCHMSCSGVSMVGIGNDVTAINAALSAAGAAASQSNLKYVLMSAALFFCGGNPIAHTASWVTLRGSGSQWIGNEIDTAYPPPLSPAFTIIWKADTVTSPEGLMGLGFATNSVQWTGSINLAADGVKESNTIRLVSGYPGSVGDLIVIDTIGDNDPNVFYGNRVDLSGYFIGDVVGSTLTVSGSAGAIKNGPVGQNMLMQFNGTVNGNSLTINSTSLGEYANNLTDVNGWPNCTIFDAASPGGTYYGYVSGGSFPNWTLSQPNTGVNITGTFYIGGVAPAINYPIFSADWGTFYGFINGGTYPNFTLDQANTGVNTGNIALGSGAGYRRAFTRQNRPTSQMIRVTGISTTSVTHDTLTLDAGLHVNFPTAFTAQIAFPSSGGSPNTSAYCIGIGVENLVLYGGNGGDGGGNIAMNTCAYSWVKNVQCTFANGTSCQVYNSFRCEIRLYLGDRSSSPNPGGGGYLVGLNNATADCLIEDSITMMGNKVVVMRGTGGGNVVGYNYMDDAFGAGYPMSPEAGINAGHFTGPHMELLEANYSGNGITADSFWGNETYITHYRNWVPGTRSANGRTYNFQYGALNAGAATSAGSNVIVFPTNQTNIYNGITLLDFQQYNVIPISPKTTATAVTPSSVTINTNTTTTSNATITFASSPAGAGVYVGMGVNDFTAGNAFLGIVISIGALSVTLDTAVSVTSGDAIVFAGTKVTLSANVQGVGVAKGDLIQFMYTGSLQNYQLLQNGNQSYPYVDSWGRDYNNLQAHCYNLNVVGNVYGYSGIAYLGFSSLAGTYQQVTMTYDDNTGASATGSNFDLYTIGFQQDPAGGFFPSQNGMQDYILGASGTLWRTGNWHWTVSGSGIPQGQIWYANIADTGPTSTGPSKTLPDSLYRVGAFAGTPSWWVGSGVGPYPPYNPANGSTGLTPAHVRAKALMGGLVTPPGNQ